MVARAPGSGLWIGLCCVTMFGLGACATKQSADAARDVAADLDDTPIDAPPSDVPIDAPLPDVPDAPVDLRDATAERTEASGDAPDAAGPDGPAPDGPGGKCTIVHLAPVQEPVDTILADVDGDGHLDIVTAEQIGSISVYRGDGHRSFAAGENYATTSSIMASHYLNSVAAGDVDGDGKVDLVGNTIYGVVGLLLTGSGSGFVATQLAAAQSDTSNHVAVADLDGDGHLDIAQPTYSHGNVGIWWGTGGGAFLPRVTAPGCTYPIHLTVIDANEDRHPDLVVGCYGGSSRVLINDGSRGFSATGTFAAGGIYRAPAAGDLNGDGHVDLAFADFFFKEVQVYLGDGTGKFSAPTGLLQKPPAMSPYATAMGDFDGDGRVDVVVGDPSLKQLYFYSGTGDGHLQSPKVLSLPMAGNNVAAADIDGDGIDDLVSDDWDSGIDVLFGPCP